MVKIVTYTNSNSISMKKLFLSFTIISLSLSLSFGQTSLKGGINGAGSTNKGFWGLNPNLAIEHNLFGDLNADFRLNGFVDIGPNEKISGADVTDYHRSLYSDLGISYKLINRKVDWSIGGGGSYQIGVEKYVATAGWTGDRLDFYETEKTNFSRFGLFLKNTISFGEAVSVNLTVYRFDFWGEYISFGPSFHIN
jgi:hypothetical protein